MNDDTLDRIRAFAPVTVANAGDVVVSALGAPGARVLPAGEAVTCAS